MPNLNSSAHSTNKSVDQLQDEFQLLNDDAMVIQGKMAILAQKLADNGFKARPADIVDPSGKDTVEF